MDCVLWKAVAVVLHITQVSQSKNNFHFLFCPFYKSFALKVLLLKQLFVQKRILFLLWAQTLCLPLDRSGCDDVCASDEVHKKLDVAFSFFQWVPGRSIVLVKSMDSARHKGAVLQPGHTSSLAGNNNTIAVLHLPLDFTMIDNS